MKLSAIISSIIFLFSIVACAQDDFADLVSKSALTQTNLPGNSYLVREENVSAEYRQLMKQYVGELRQGKSELLVLTNGDSKKTDAIKLRKQFETSLQTGGWDFQVHGEEKGVTFFTAIKKSPTRQNIFGYWLMVDDRLLIAMAEVFKNDGSPVDSGGGTTSHNSGDSANPVSNNDVNQNPTKPSNNSLAGTQTFNLSATDENVNVMGNQMPPIPSFPALTKKPGKIRGYVKDTNGNFLSDAAISLGSIRIGYSRLVTQTVTDSKGYYELDLALNSAKFQYAAYAVDYGESKAAMALHPVDGSLDDNPPGEGGIENFVLLPYGIADRAMMAENSNYGASFYGGSISLFIDVGYVGANDDINKGRFYPGSTVEITLTPLGNMIDESSSKTFVIRKKIEENTRNTLFINNVPVAKYKISVKTNGKSVGMKQRLPENSIFGIKPVQASGEAEILFYPSSGKPSEIGAGTGGWQNVEIYLEAPSR
jgi:hypothetical protein